MEEWNLRISEDDEKCCGGCEYFRNESVYGVGTCEKHLDDCTHCSYVCDDFRDEPNK